MNETKIMYCSGCGAALDANINQAFVFCKYCGAKNVIESQQMTSAVNFGDVKLAANVDTENLISTAEYAIAVGDLDKAYDLLMSAVYSGNADYRVYINKAKIDLWTDDNAALFESLEKLREIEQASDSPKVTEAIRQLMNYRGLNGVTMLHNATFHERLDLVKYCVEHGANVNCYCGMNNVTPLTIMYVPLDAKTTSKLDGTPFIRNKENVKQIREYLLSHGAVESRRDKKRLSKAGGINKIVYILLALFVGGIGIHKFYAGKIGTGILYLLFSITGIPSILALIDVFVAASIPADATGRIRV